MSEEKRLVDGGEREKDNNASEFPTSKKRTVPEKGILGIPEGGKPKPANSKITFADVKGLVEAKKIVKDALIDPILYPEVHSGLKIIPGSGLLLYGPPGTGKTMFARAIANELKTDFLPVTMTDLRGKNPVQTSELISSTFEKARSCVNGCVLFIDDCEELLSRPGNSKAYGVSQFLNELDGMKQSGKGGKVFLLIATNRPWMIDSAILREGRIGASVYVGLPEKETRKEIILAALRENLIAADVDIDRLAEMTEGYSGAEIYHGLNGGGVCNKARVFAKDRWIKRIEVYGDGERNRVEPICFADFERALKEVTPTAVRDAERIRKNEEFRNASDKKPQTVNVDLPKRDFAYRVDDENEIKLSTPDVVQLKNYVFNSSIIQETPDYKHFADSTYFLYNDEYGDSQTFNAYASTISYLSQRYGINLSEMGGDPNRPAIVVYDGLNIANTAVAAAFLKHNPNMFLKDTKSLRQVLVDLNLFLCRNCGRITVGDLANLDNEYDLFPSDSDMLHDIKRLASVMGAFTIAHELGHIIYGDIFKVHDDGVYSRNMERSADQFAADVLNGIQDEDDRELLFLGAALHFVGHIALGRADEKISAEDSHTHPATLDRFRNLLKNAPETIEQFGFDEEKFLQCIP